MPCPSQLYREHVASISPTLEFQDLGGVESRGHECASLRVQVHAQDLLDA